MNFPDIIYRNDNYMDILRATGNNENIILHIVLKQQQLFLEVTLKLSNAAFSCHNYELCDVNYTSYHNIVNS